MKTKKIDLSLLLIISLILILLNIQKDAANRFLFSWDYATMFVPWKNFLIESIKNYNTIPLWNPYNFCGEPYWTNLQTTILYPFNIIFFIFSMEWAYEIKTQIHYLLTSIFYYLFFKELFFNKLSIIFSTVIIIFSHFFIFNILNITVLYAITYLPILLLILIKIIKKGTFKYYLLFIFASVLMFLSGHLQYIFYNCLYLTFVFIYYLIRKKISKKTFIKVVISVVIILLIISIQYYPILKTLNLFSRSQVDYSTFGQLHPIHLITGLIPDLFGNSADNSFIGFYYRPLYNNINIYEFIGIFPLLIILFSIIILFKKNSISKHKIIVLLIGIITPVLISLGDNTFFMPIVSSIIFPFRWFRLPYRILYIYVVNSALLTGLVIDDNLMKSKNECQKLKNHLTSIDNSNSDSKIFDSNKSIVISSNDNLINNDNLIKVEYNNNNNNKTPISNEIKSVWNTLTSRINNYYNGELKSLEESIDIEETISINNIVSIDDLLSSLDESKNEKESQNANDELTDESLLNQKTKRAKDNNLKPERTFQNYIKTITLVMIIITLTILGIMAFNQEGIITYLENRFIRNEVDYEKQVFVHDQFYRIVNNIIFFQIKLFIIYIIFTITKKKKIYITAILIFTCLDLLSFNLRFIRYTDSFDYPESKKIIEYIKSDKGLYRVLSLLNTDSTFDKNKNLKIQKHSVKGDNPLIMNNFKTFFNKIETDFSKVHANTPVGIPDIKLPVLDTLSIKYIISRDDISNKKFELILEDKNYQQKLYLNTMYKPIFFTSNSIIKDANIIYTEEYNSQTDIYIKNFDVDFNSNNNTEKDIIKIIKYTPNIIELEVNKRSPGILVFSDTYHNNWSCLVNGQKDKIYKVNELIKGIYLESGKHRVKFYFTIF